MKPFVLVTVEDNCVSNTTVVGDSQVEVIVVDYDTVLDPEEAQDLIDQIVAKYEGTGTAPTGDVRLALNKLEAIIDGDEDEGDEDEDFDTDDDEDMEDDDEDMEFSDDDDEEDIDLGDESEIDDEINEGADDEGKVLGGPGLGRG